MSAAGPGMDVLCPRRRNAAWQPCASMAHFLLRIHSEEGVTFEALGGNAAGS
jgi:hypothetical protein